MDEELTPIGGLSFFASDPETYTRQAGFIVPTLFEPITLSTQIIDDSEMFSVQRIRVYRHESVLVPVAPPPNGVNPVGGNTGGGGKLQHQDKWVLVREVDGPGPILAYAGESVILDVAFDFSLAFTYVETIEGMLQDTFDATLNVSAPPLTFAPYPISVTTGHVSTNQLDTPPLYPSYGGSVNFLAAVNFGESTYGTYRLIDMSPAPGGPIDINQGTVTVELPKSQSVNFSIPITVSAAVALGDYTFTFQESAYDGQQTQDFQANVTIAKPGFGI